MTTAQVLFSVALTVISLIIVAFAIYVVLSAMWGGRWVRTRPVGRTQTGQAPVGRAQVGQKK